MVTTIFDSHRAIDNKINEKSITNQFRAQFQARFPARFRARIRARFQTRIRARFRTRILGSVNRHPRLQDNAYFHEHICQLQVSYASVKPVCHSYILPSLAKNFATETFY